MRYSWYAIGFQFDSHLADFTFYQAYLLPIWVSVRLALA